MIDSVDLAKFLGINLDKELNFKEHVRYVQRRVGRDFKHIEVC